MAALLVPVDALSRGYPRTALVYRAYRSFLFPSISMVVTNMVVHDRLGCSLSSSGRLSCLVAHSLHLFIYCVDVHSSVWEMVGMVWLSSSFLLYIMTLFLLCYVLVRRICLSIGKAGAQLPVMSLFVCVLVCNGRFPIFYSRCRPTT